MIESRVSLISYTLDPLDTIYVGARTCYYPGTPTQLKAIAKTKTTEEKAAFVDKVLGSGHLSVAEHANWTFSVEGISRACAQQLLRYRHCSPSGQSLRYVEIKENIEELKKLSCNNLNYLISILSKYIVGVNNTNAMKYLQELIFYLEETKAGTAPEDARMLLPLATKTNLVTTFNLREFMHICGERLCTKAQPEIRGAVKQMKELVVNQEPWTEKYLIAKCMVDGICREQKSCGLYKTR